MSNQKYFENLSKQKEITRLKAKIEAITNSLTATNFEEKYREISQLTLKLDRIRKYKDHTLCKQMNWNISVASF